MKQLAKLATLFPLAELEVITYPERIRAMWAYYGVTEGRKCKTCLHLGQQGGVQGTYYKCNLNRRTAGPATDWRVNWPACGKWKAAHQGKGQGNSR